MNERKPSKHMVTIFDPNKDPSVTDIALLEKKLNPKVKAVASVSRLGLIKTDHGTCWLDPEGCGQVAAGGVEKNGCRVGFHRHFEDGSFETVSFGTAKYSLDECLACATGETLRLDEFIERGDRKDANFAQWAKFLE